VSWPGRIPGPEELAEHPELAALEGLELALSLANHALIAANGELASEDFIRDMAMTPAVAPCLAYGVLIHIDGLRDALRRYREYIHLADERRRALQPDY
jgi:hypothetical protein